MEFKSNKHFVISSVLKKYEFIHPTASPLTNVNVKGEQVYLWKDVTELHTKAGWKKLWWLVKPGSTYLKAVRGHYNEKNKQALLFGYW